MLALAGIIALFGIIIWAVVSVNREALEGFGILGWLVIVLFMVPLYSWLLEHELVIEFSIIFLILYFAWIFSPIGGDIRDD